MNKCQLVKNTCNKLTSESSEHVKIDQQKLQLFCDNLIKSNEVKFDKFWLCHSPFSRQMTDNQLVQFIFYMDSLNFCFWRLNSDFEYDNLVAGLQTIFENYNENKLTSLQLIEQIFKIQDEERIISLEELRTTMKKEFNNDYLKLINLANKSATELVGLITKYFTRFQDHAISSSGKQIFFYKRAQILVADLWAAFEGKGPGEFYDISELTTFPDYRVPQILNQEGILVYSDELNKKIKNDVIILAGSQIELEIRAGTVVAVEKIKEYLTINKIQLNSIEIDWLLWQMGERNKDSIVKHHKTMTIYY